MQKYILRFYLLHVCTCVYCVWEIKKKMLTEKNPPLWSIGLCLIDKVKILVKKDLIPSRKESVNNKKNNEEY